MSATTGPGFDPIQRATELWQQRWGEDSPHAAMASATSIMRVQQLLIAQLDAAVAAYDLTFARYEALVLLTFSRRGELPMSKIGERLMIHPTSATNIVQRLSADGYVERRRNPRDGRGTLAAITPRGREVVELATAALHGIEFGLAALGDGEHAALQESLRKVRRASGDLPD
ncbi:MarR family winged helix-turn-helix transcriptional regulator [Flexivirga meconopsidis]|uniref:MarR family winged helix-turn-helix transcriptional regulator n=1 Tax=Flexivirga meconopsidis TaxID=2977121 RepID=UPI00223F2D2B|nr:MarR family transcriptional regulator [Flexivirga meconopsidis]